VQVGIVGGTGPAGRGLAVRASIAGHDVRLGSRDEDRARDVVASLRIPQGARVTGCTNEVAAQAELVVVATPWDAVVATVRPLAPALDGKVVVSMVNALIKQGREMVALLPARGSMAAELQAALPGASVTAALHHLPASLMEDADSGLLADVLVCGDDAGARGVTGALIDSIEGLRAIEVGSLAQAGAIESFTAACISINIRHKVHSTVRLGGI
jgi:8-hydroxy-5-deazaflavin:NADPH oxidoreductase